jgi:hypothetical protein
MSKIHIPGERFLWARTYRRSAISPSIVGLVLVMLAPQGPLAAVAAQGPIRLDQPCRECSVEERTLAIIGGSDTNFTLGAASRIARLSSGRWVAGPLLERGKIVLLDSAGRFVRLLGRPGQGPEDFGSINGLIAGKADTLFVWDRSNSRVAIYDGSMKLVRTVQLSVGAANGFALLPSGGLLFSSVTAPPRFHVVDRAGRLTGSFGSEVILETGPNAGQHDAGNEKLVIDTRYAAVSPRTGTVWAARMNRMDLSEWDTRGQHLRRIILEPDWFAPWTVSAKVDPSWTFTSPAGTTSPLTQGVQVDDEGRVWVYVLVTDPAWTRSQPARAVTPPTTGRGSSSAINALTRWDTMLLSIDPARRVALGSRRFDMATFPVSGCTCAAKYKVDQDGLVSFEIVAVSVTAR